MKSKIVSTPGWLSLMYSTGALLIFCGAPAGVFIGFGLGIAVRSGIQASFIAGAFMALASGILGCILLFVAGMFDKERKASQRKMKKSTKDVTPNS